MKNQQIKLKNVFASFGCLSLILISNNGELRAKYNINNYSGLNKKNASDFTNNANQFEIENILRDKVQNISLVGNEIAQKQDNTTSNVLISEIIIKGWEDHPEGRKLELAAYDSMTIKPGSIVNNQMLKKDLNSIYASGWFSGVKIKSEEGPLGVKLIVEIVPNPILKKILISPENKIVSDSYVNKTFDKSFGTTLNLNDLQKKINIIKKWYEDKGYSLARISGPERISSNGIVSLKIDEGVVSNINLRFIGTDEKVRKGKTKEWVIRRELKTSSGTIFNRKTLESDIKRLYATSLFNDIKVSLGPDNENPGRVIITLDISEQRTGSLTGGLGFSNAAGLFAQMGLQETNAFGRAWSTSLNLNFGEYSTTYNFSLFDPWIKGDKHRTAFKTNVFLSRDYPQEFRSEDHGRFYVVNDRTSTASDGFNSVVLENIGGGFSFIRPLNGGDPFKDATWKVQTGMNFRKVSIIDSGGELKPYATLNPTTAKSGDIICVGYVGSKDECYAENTLVSVLASTSRNKLDNSANPTSGSILRLGSEQFLPLGETSPTFNRMRASYAFFIPTRLIKLTKGCKSDNSDAISCPQTIGFSVKTGTMIGDIPPYEAFCMGGSSSVRGWGNCDLSVSKSFVEGSTEYRFPVWRMLSGSLFADLGWDIGSQESVPGKPGPLLKKKGHGFSLGGGIGVKTPVGPLRIDAATQDLSGNMRYTLGVGWKF